EKQVPAVAALVFLLGACPGLHPCEAFAAGLVSEEVFRTLKDDPAVTWQQVDQTADDPGVEVPKLGAGWVRLRFHGESLLPQRLTVEVWTGGRENGTATRLEAQVNFVRPILIRAEDGMEPEQLGLEPDVYPWSVGTLNTGTDPLTRNFIVWSSTRTQFPLE